MGRSIGTSATPRDPVVDAYARRHGLDTDLFHAVWTEERRRYGGDGTSPQELSLATCLYLAEVKRAQQA